MAIPSKSGPHLWEKIGRILQHKNQGDVKIEKIKAHREPEKAAGEEELWGIIGNSKADADAKKALYEDLVLHSTNGQIIKKRLQQQIEVAYLCSLMPQDITKHAESLRKEGDKQERVQEPEQPLPLAARGVCSPTSQKSRSAQTCLLSVPTGTHYGSNSWPAIFPS